MPRKNARALVVGLGGLGCPAAIALARAGVGHVALLDDDEVDPSNLHRQILYREGDVGAPKVLAAARALEAFGGSSRFEPIRARLLPETALELVRRFDVVIEGADNFPTKFLAADACGLAGVPVVHGAAVRWYGTALAAGPSGPCYRCLFEDIPEDEAPNCDEAGVMGPVVGVVGALQASLALGVLDGQAPFGRLFTFDGKADTLRALAVPKRPGCALCAGPRPRALAREDYLKGAACRAPS
ncbi:MAG: HesA/MoeB/ThiF family protein [Myxococcales bacterium]|nr:HesA/MoeB/ThiF family protein [Myxococcales bacterium]